MKPFALGMTTFTLAALTTTGCAARDPLGPTAPPDRPSLFGAPAVDRNGNGVWCLRRVGNPGDVEPAVVIEASGAVLVDDIGGSCPTGFQRSDV